MGNEPRRVFDDGAEPAPCPMFVLAAVDMVVGIFIGVRGLGAGSGNFLSRTKKRPEPFRPRLEPHRGYDWPPQSCRTAPPWRGSFWFEAIQTLPGPRLCRMCVTILSGTPLALVRQCAARAPPRGTGRCRRAYRGQDRRRLRFPAFHPADFAFLDGFLREDSTAAWVACFAAADGRESRAHESDHREVAGGSSADHRSARCESGSKGGD